MYVMVVNCVAMVIGRVAIRAISARISENWKERFMFDENYLWIKVIW